MKTVEKAMKGMDFIKGEVYEFDAMLEKGLEQAKANEGRLAENVLADVVKGYERGEEKSGESFRHRTFEERVAEYGGKIGVDGEFDWGEPVGREIW